MMEEFELLRNVTIGQYLPLGSVVHRLDPRAKIIGGILLIGALTFNTSIIANIIMLGTIAAVVQLSRVPFGYVLRGLRLGLGVIIALAIMQLLLFGRTFGADSPLIFEWWLIRITEGSVRLMIISIFRLTGFILLTSLITLTSTTTELTHGLESLMQPFRRFGVPAHELALVNTIALRFVPTLAEELERIMKAQASRGADFGTRGRWRFIQNTKAILPLVVPLFINAFQRAEELILAMEARCYMGGAGRTKFVVLRSTPRDYLVVALATGYFLFMTFYRWPPVKSLLYLFGLTLPWAQ